jgi:hypothetical protein
MPVFLFFFVTLSWSENNLDSFNKFKQTKEEKESGKEDPKEHEKDSQEEQVIKE